MSTLSNALDALTESLSGYEGTGLMLSADAVKSLKALLGTATADAKALERMLERRLRASDLPNATPRHAATDNIVEFRPRGATA